MKETPASTKAVAGRDTDGLNAELRGQAKNQPRKNYVISDARVSQEDYQAARKDLRLTQEQIDLRPAGPSVQDDRTAHLASVTAYVDHLEKFDLVDRAITGSEEQARVD